MAEKTKPPFYLIDTSSDFYRPRGLRIGICIATAIWAGVETWNGDGFWSVIAIAIAIYCLYVLIIKYVPPEPKVIAAPAEADESGDDTPQA